MNKLNEKIMKSEGKLCGLILKQPTLLNDYNINKKLLSEDALFYIGVTERLLNKGIEHVDEISFLSDIESISSLVDLYNKRGGYKTIKELMEIVNVNNADAIVDEWNKWNLIRNYNNKGILDYEKHWDKIDKMSASQVVDYIEYHISDIDINITSDIVFENLNLTNDEITSIKNGANIGINYGKHSPILNYLSLGLPLGDLTMFASYSNGGKSSYIMSNIVIPIAEQGIKVGVIANEQKSIAYKLLLQQYVLTEVLGYYKLPRKKFKTGHWTTEDEEMVQKARQIIKEKYAPYITFVKLYDYDMKKVSKIAKKMSRTGMKVMIYDTMKYSGDGSDSVWMSLIQDSKDLFQICSKLDIAGVVSFQLAPSTKNRLRNLDEEALANGKQVKEVFSEMFAFRDLWDDEWDGEPFDIKPYKLKKDANGKFTGEKEYLKLDKNKIYKIFCHFKTRNDAVGNTILYEYKGHINKWVELGYCTVSTKNRY